jgi:hypothetical protein
LLRRGGPDALAAVLGAAIVLSWPGELPAELRTALWRPFRAAGLEDA